jgi:hypothetical protein
VNIVLKVNVKILVTRNFAISCFVFGSFLELKFYWHDIFSDSMNISRSFEVVLTIWTFLVRKKFHGIRQGLCSFHSVPCV